MNVGSIGALLLSPGFFLLPFWCCVFLNIWLICFKYLFNGGHFYDPGHEYEHWLTHLCAMNSSSIIFRVKIPREMLCISRCTCVSSKTEYAAGALLITVIAALLHIVGIFWKRLVCLSGRTQCNESICIYIVLLNKTSLRLKCRHYLVMHMSMYKIETMISNAQHRQSIHLMDWHDGFNNNEQPQKKTTSLSVSKCLMKTINEPAFSVVERTMNCILH